MTSENLTGSLPYRLAILAVAVTLAACNSESSQETSSDDPDKTLIAGTLKYPAGSDHPDGTLVQGHYSGVTDKRLTVIRNINDFSELWYEHTSIVSPQPAQPEVAFGSEMVVAAFAGTKPTGGYSLEITSIDEYEQRIDVTVELGRPGDDCVTTQAETHPYHMVAIPDSDKSVMFNEVETGNGC